MSKQRTSVGKRSRERTTPASPSLGYPSFVGRVPWLTIICFLLATVVFAACGPNQRILNSAQETQANAAPTADSNATPTVRSFEYDLNAMRTADFNFIYVIRRKDGGILGSDDKSFIIKTAPPEMNRRTLSDDGKAVIIGSNFRLPAENLTAFRERFAIDDQSKSEFRSTDASNQKAR